MSHRVGAGRSLSWKSVGAAALLSGCLGNIEESREWEAQDAPVGSRELSLEDAIWTDCARSGGFCEFSGTRQVRYGRFGRYVVGTFTDGVECRGEPFGTRSLFWAVCQLADDVEPEPEPEPSPEPEPAPEPEPDPPMDGGHSMHDNVNVDAIPTGSAGSSTYRVRSTDEAPSPSDGTGQFRTVCAFSHMNFDDPIVYPGEPGRSHLHTYFGNTLADAYSTTETLTSSGNSTCRGGIANRSAYWVPATIDEQGNPIAPDVLHVYYKSGYHLPPEAIEPFPAGLRIIAGGKPSDPATLPSPYIHYGCEARGYDPVTTIPECDPGDQLIMVVLFPQCWDGVRLDSPDHRSHMAYPSGGACPDTHPVAIPAITFRVHYMVPPEGTSGWRLVSDDMSSVSPGESLHADWFSGWDESVVEEFVTNCDNAAVDCHSHLLGPYRMLY